MTDRHAGYVVTLEDDIREDDAAELIRAISMIRGVAAVVPVEASLEDVMARSRRDGQWRDALLRLCRHGPGK